MNKPKLTNEMQQSSKERQEREEARRKLAEAKRALRDDNLKDRASGTTSIFTSTHNHVFIILCP